MRKPIAVIDLYCGMGGFTEGAIQAGAKVILSCDFWDEAIEVHKLNHPGIPCIKLKLGSDSDWKLIKQFIDKYPNYHIHLHGSPPCQALSNASSSDSSEGMPLVLHFLDLVEKLNPDSWSMENVVPVRKKLPEGTPSVVLNSADFGVPQTRRRCIAGSGWIAQPTHRKDQWVSVSEALPGITGLMDSGRADAKTTGINPRTGKKEGGSGFLSRSLDNPSYTIMTSPRRLVKLEAKPKTIRSLTLSETLILQGFNPDYDLSVTKTKKSRWTMVGNAVCPPVAKAIIEGIGNG